MWKAQHGNVAAHIPIFQDPWQHAPQSQPLLQQGLAQQHSSQLGHLSAQHERCCPGPRRCRLRHADVGLARLLRGRLGRGDWLDVDHVASVGAPPAVVGEGAR